VRLSAFPEFLGTKRGVLTQTLSPPNLITAKRRIALQHTRI
jgi:hypothetical protein